MPSIRSFVTAPDETSARSMAIGSHLAGRAIDVSKTTAAHAVSYRITKRFGVSHGHAVALTLGAFLDVHADADASALQPSIGFDDHRAAMEEVCRRLGVTATSPDRRRLARCSDDLGLPSRLGAVGATAVRC